MSIINQKQFEFFIQKLDRGPNNVLLYKHYSHIFSQLNDKSSEYCFIQAQNLLNDLSYDKLVEGLPAFIKGSLSVFHQEFYKYNDNNQLPEELKKTIIQSYTLIWCKFVHISGKSDGVLLSNLVNDIIKILYTKNPKLMDDPLDKPIYEYITGFVYNLVSQSDFFQMDFVEQYSNSKHKNRTVVKPNQKCIHMFSGYTELVGINLPSLIQPQYQHPYQILTKSHKNIGSITLSQNVLSCAQYLASTCFIINTSVLDWLKSNKNMWMTPKYLDYKSVQGKTSKHAYKLIAINYHKYYEHESILHLADLLSLLPKFYYHVYVDWRGRFYAKGDIINYQASKIGLSLLKFKHGKPIGSKGLFFLRVYGANLYGVNFRTNESKIKWIEKHHYSIINLEPDFIAKAKNIPLFVAFAIEYRNCICSDNPLEFVSNLPILIDCTCNGLQHLAAMVSDIYTSKQVNLYPDNLKQDIYQHVASRIDKISGVHFPITRDMVKKIVMTIPYNVSFNSATLYLLDSFKYDSHTKLYYYDSPHNSISYQSLSKIAKVIYTTFYYHRPLIKNLVVYFTKMAELMSFFNLPIRWITPQGMQIIQYYTKFNKQILQYKKRRFAITLPTNKLCKVKQTNGLMPNIIHSLDATNIVNLFQNVSTQHISIFTIHDCFASVPADTLDVQNYVKNGFVSIYITKDFLYNFHKACIDMLKHLDPNSIIIDQDKHTIYYEQQTISIPKIPVFGSADIQQVLKSEYMVS